MADGVCSTCGRTFKHRDRTKVLGKHYCSRECWYGRNHPPEAPLLQERKCTHCGAVYTVRRGVLIAGKRPFCSAVCYHAHNRGENHGQWAGGRWLEQSKGYICIAVKNGGHRPEHIVIAEKVLGRRLRKGEVVHHVNGDKTDNRQNNLLICTNVYHTALHQRMSMLYAKEHFKEMPNG